MLGRLKSLFERASPPALAMTGAMLTDLGSVRDSNEDAVAYVMRPEASLAVVADGMGGHAAGEVASRIAIDEVTRVFFEHGGDITTRLRGAFETANAAILAHVAHSPQTAGMGTTCTALAFSNDAVWLAHVGDSRAYRVRRGTIAQISRDHSLVADLVAAGQMTEAQAADSPEKNVILRAMGIAPLLDPQITSAGDTIRDGDVYVLCSDGLSDLVTPAAIAEAVGERAPDAACEVLVAAALAAGGHDNISVGVFRAGPSPDAVAAPPTREMELRA